MKFDITLVRESESGTRESILIKDVEPADISNQSLLQLAEKYGVTIKRRIVTPDSTTTDTAKCPPAMVKDKLVKLINSEVTPPGNMQSIQPSVENQS